MMHAWKAESWVVWYGWSGGWVRASDGSEDGELTWSREGRKLEVKGFEGDHKVDMCSQERERSKAKQELISRN